MPTYHGTCRRCGVQFEFRPSPSKPTRTYCSLACLLRRFPPAEERFWANVANRGGDGCWEWNGCHLRSGYGRLKLNGREVRAHTFSYELHIGPVPEGRIVCHHCDNPRCVRPDHLYAGTYATNAQDCIRRGRRRPRLAESHPNSKLTCDQVRAIRKEYSNGGITQKALAAKHGVTAMVVNGIVHGRVWKTVT